MTLRAPVDLWDGSLRDNDLAVLRTDVIGGSEAVEEIPEAAFLRVVYGSIGISDNHNAKI